MPIRSKRLIFLFAWGVFVGFCLEIILLERKSFNFDNFLDSYGKKESNGVTCLVLLKHKTVNFLNASKETWLRHCTDYFVVEFERTKSKSANVPFDVTKSDSKENSEKICTSNSKRVTKLTGKSGWGALCKSLHVTKVCQSDWLVIVPDTVLVLVENLKLFVKNLDADEPHYYGYGIKHYEADFNTLSAGILLSRGSLNMLFSKFKSEDECDHYGKYWKNEDVHLGKFLKEFEIVPRDTRDSEGRGRFHGYNMQSLLYPGKLFLHSDYIRKALFPVPEGVNCCSSHLITLDVASPSAMYKFYFLLYNVVTKHKTLPPLLHPSMPKSVFWMNFMRSRGYYERDIEKMTSEEYYKIWEKILPPKTMYDQIRSFLTQNEHDL